MKKIISIFSHGPMGSSTIGSIIEHFDFLNIPIRKYGLYDYISNKKNLDDNFFENRIIESANQLTSVTHLGGRSMIERNLNKNIFFDKKLLNDLEQFFKKKNKSKFREKLFDCYNIFNNNLNYKKKKKYYNGIIEYPTSIHYNDPIKVYENYNKEFKEFQFFAMTRNFEDWFASLMSQTFIKKKFKLKHLNRRLSSIYKDYKTYIKFISNLPNCKIIDFDRIFEKKHKIIEDLELGEIFDIENKEFDHWTKLLVYNQTFEKFDKKEEIFSSFSLWIIKFFLNKKFFFFIDTLMIDIMGIVSFGIDNLRFKKKFKKIII